MGTKILAISLGGTALALVLAGAAVMHRPQGDGEVPGRDEYPIRIALPPPAGGSGSPLAAAHARAEGEVVPQPTEPSESAASDLFPDWTSRARPGEKPGGAQRLWDVRFDLAQASSRGEYTGSSASLEVRKPVDLDGAYRGEARIYVLSDSLLAINREELGRLLAKAGRPSLEGRRAPGSESAGEMITFDDLRELGIGIRYDPNGDRILVST